MNLLAHLLLASQHELSLRGTLMGDFVKGELGGRFDQQIREAITLHRRIDGFSDAHEAFSRSRRRIDPSRRRYGGVFIDIFYDHFLSRHFEDYAGEKREPFIARVYDTLRGEGGVLPGRMGQLFDFMIETDLLGSYNELEGIDDALRRMSKRASRPEAFRHAASDLTTHYAAFEKDFRDFYPELERFVAGHMATARAAAKGSTRSSTGPQVEPPTR